MTLVFAPIAASLGLAVAKLSGRGLGHTGGTLDKLESIPGLRTDLDPDAFERQVEEVGSAVAAQTADLVPADGALYALRDATATVPSVPLIAASVMSKKLAIGTDLVLLDVKAGSGAFMKTPDDAAELAEACTALAKDWGRPTRAAVTDMSQPLGEAIGNALDVVEAVRLLRGELHGRLRDAAVMFAGEAVSRLSDVPMGEGRARAAAALDSGEALEAFRAMVQAQGGDPRVVDDPEGVLPAAPVVRPFAAERAGTPGGRRRRGARARERRARRGEEEEGRPDRPGGRHRLPAEGGRPPRGRTGARAGARPQRRGRGGVHPIDPGRDDPLGRSGRASAARVRVARLVDDLKFAAYLGISLVPALVLHEYAHAFVAVRLGDPTAKRWGRLTLNPKPLIDPFGSLILPALALILVAARGVLLLPVFAYAKPMPVDPTSFKNPRRDLRLVVLAGLLANIVLAFLAGAR